MQTNFFRKRHKNVHDVDKTHWKRKKENEQKGKTTEDVNKKEKELKNEQRAKENEKSTKKNFKTSEMSKGKRKQSTQQNDAGQKKTTSW